MEKENVILKLSFQLAIDIIQYTEILYSMKRFPIANQLFKSGTSIGAHVREAQSPESRADFIHKMKGAHKEAEETIYWLEICLASPVFPNPGKLLQDTRIVKRIIGKIISSGKRGGNQPPK